MVTVFDDVSEWDSINNRDGIIGLRSVPVAGSGEQYFACLGPALPPPDRFSQTQFQETLQTLSRSPHTHWAVCISPLYPLPRSPVQGYWLAQGSSASPPPISLSTLRQFSHIGTTHQIKQRFQEQNSEEVLSEIGSIWVGRVLVASTSICGTGDRVIED